MIVALLQDHLCGKEPGLTDDLQAILSSLTSLNKTENAKVALGAREVRIVVAVFFLLLGSTFGVVLLVIPVSLKT